MRSKPRFPDQGAIASFNYWIGVPSEKQLEAYAVVINVLLTASVEDTKNILDNFNELLTVCVALFTEEQLMNAIVKKRMGLDQ